MQKTTNAPCETFNPRTPAFEIGATPRAMIVLKVTKRASQIRKWRYLVRASICGHETDLSHKTLLDTQVSAYPGLCGSCMRQQKRLDVIAERIAAGDKDAGPPVLTIKPPSKYLTEQALAREEQLANRWTHALWSKPSEVVLRPHAPALGLVNFISF